MTAADLADLNGLLATVATRRAKRGDKRDKSVIADELLAAAGMPDLRLVIEWLSEELRLR
jgi:hypothetical protein